MDDITSIDLYGLLGIEQTSSIQEIKKAYRKKALTCHPDKNPDNPETVALFLRLSKALEVLIDETARLAYDKILNARKAVEQRHRKLDSQRKKFKEELDAREQQAHSGSYFSSTTNADEERLKKRIDLLRQEGSKQLKEEVDYIKRKLYERMSDPSSNCRLKIHWNNHEGYDVQSLHSVFSKYGKITALVISQKKKGSALIEFSSPKAVMSAIHETGNERNPLKAEFLSTAYNKRCKTHIPKHSSPNIFTSDNDEKVTCDIDEFEANVLGLLKQAQERKNLSEDIKNEDNNGS